MNTKTGYVYVVISLLSVIHAGECVYVHIKRRIISMWEIINESILFRGLSVRPNAQCGSFYFNETFYLAMMLKPILSPIVYGLLFDLKMCSISRNSTRCMHLLHFQANGRAIKSFPHDSFCFLVKTSSFQSTICWKLYSAINTPFTPKSIKPLRMPFLQHVTFR